MGLFDSLFGSKKKSGKAERQRQALKEAEDIFVRLALTETKQGEQGIQKAAEVTVQPLPATMPNSTEAATPEAAFGRKETNHLSSRPGKFNT